MRCNHCRSLMLETEIVKEGHTEQTWYECPTCGRTHLFSRCLPGHNVDKTVQGRSQDNQFMRFFAEEFR